MTMNKTAVTAIISLALLVGFGGSAIARSDMAAHMNGGNMGAGNAQTMHARGGQMSNLTTEQQAARQKAFDQFQTSTADLRQQMMSKRYEYKALLTSKPVDEQKVAAVGKEIGALQDRMNQSRVEMDIQLAKAGVPMMGGHGSMKNHGSQGNGHSGMHSGKGCK